MTIAFGGFLLVMALPAILMLGAVACHLILKSGYPQRLDERRAIQRTESDVRHWQ